MHVIKEIVRDSQWKMVLELSLRKLNCMWFPKKDSAYVMKMYVIFHERQYEV